MKVLGLKSSKFYSEKPTDVVQEKHAYYNTSFLANSIAKEDDEQKKKGLSAKKLTNIIGTLAGIGIIGGSYFYMKRRPMWMKISTKDMGVLETKINNKKEQMEVALRTAEGNEKKGNLLYRFGSKVQGAVDRIGDELSNNLLYGLGTLAIMPLVILFSPFGKKDSSKEDKAFAVIRQPISFATMFSIQLTNDKMFSRWAKSLVDQNWLEEADIVNKETREIIKGEEGYAEEVLSKIKYNSKPLKEHFNKKCNELLGKNNLTEVEKSALFKIKNPEMQKKEFAKLMETKQVNEKILKELTKHFDRFVEAGCKSKLTTEAIKIVVNVLVSQVIGCTLLNVIYGKIMKGWTLHKEHIAASKALEHQDKNAVSDKDRKVA